MQDLAPAIEVYPVHHLPIIKAYSDQLGLVLSRPTPINSASSA